MRTAKYLPALDGLRGVAVISVLLFHGAVDAFRGGFLGVDLFFVVSGFLITRLLLIEVEDRGRVDLAAFYQRRVRRLYPAMLLVLVCVTLFAVAFSSDAQQVLIRRDVLGASFYVHNWVQVAAEQSYFADFGEPSPLRHLWSLAVEEQWYLIWPLLVAACARFAPDPRRAVLWVSGVAATGSALWMVWLESGGASVDRLYYSTDARLHTIALGSVLGAMQFRAVSDRTRSLVGAAGAAVVAAMVIGVTGTERWLYSGGLTAFALASVAVVWASSERSGLSSTLSWRPLVAVGKISYSLYLWHWPVFVGLNPESTGLSGTTLLALRLAVSLAAAAVSYRLVEQPIRTMEVSGRLVGSALAASLGVAAIAWLGVAGPATAEDTEREVPDLFVPTTTGSVDTTVPADVGATITTTPGPETVLVIGDSIAQSFTLFVNVEPAGAEFRLNGGALFGCGLASSRTAADAETDAAREPQFQCFRRFEIWERVIASSEPSGVLLMVGGWEVFDLDADGNEVDFGGEAWRASMIGSLDRLRVASEAADTPLLVATVPCFDAKELALPGDQSIVRNDIDRVELVNELFATYASEHDGVDLIDVAAVVCPAGTPLAELDGIELRPDGVHYSAEGATRVWADIDDRVSELIR